METYHSTSVRLGKLALAAVRSEMLDLALLSSDTLGVALPDGPGTTVSSSLRSRAVTLLSAWRSVTQPRTDGARLLTLAGLRSCSSVLAVDSYLDECKSSATANLMSYLRCTVFVAPP
jgi:hypothetical protein